MCGIILAFAWQDQGKPQKNLYIVIQTGHLLNIGHKHYHLSHLLGKTVLLYLGDTWFGSLLLPSFQALLSS
jgi:hypothetical protein